jgi:hypothetical protein
MGWLKMLRAAYDSMPLALSTMDKDRVDVLFMMASGTINRRSTSPSSITLHENQHKLDGLFCRSLHRSTASPLVSAVLTYESILFLPKCWSDASTWRAELGSLIFQSYLQSFKA